MKTLIIKSIMFIIFLTSLNAFAQYGRDWVRRYDYLEGTDIARDIAVDNNGYSYVTGNSYSDLTTINYDATGNKLWEARYNSGGGGAMVEVGYSVALGELDDEGYPFIYVTGTTAVTYDNLDYVILKYKRNGVLQWARTYNGTGNGVDIAVQVIVDNFGNSYITGRSMGVNGNFDYVTIKYNSAGTLQWSQRFDDENRNDRAVSLAYSNSIVYVTGVSEISQGVANIITIAYNSATGGRLWMSYHLGNRGGIDAWKNTIAADYSRGVYVVGQSVLEGWDVIALIKYNPVNGEEIWVQNTLYYGYPTSIGIFPKRIGRSWAHTNDIYVTGFVDWKFGVVKYDDNGTFQWVDYCFEYNNVNVGRSLSIDNNENVCVTGIVYDYDNNGDYGTVIWDKDGNKIYNDIYVGGNGVDIAYAVAHFNGNFYVTGQSAGNETNSDYVTIKYSLSGFGPMAPQTPNITLKENNLKPTSYLLSQNYPNPFNPVTNIKYQLPKDGYVVLKVYDITGKEIARLVDEYKTAGFYSVVFDASQFASGMYFYRIFNKDFSETKKMLVIK